MKQRSPYKMRMKMMIKNDHRDQDDEDDDDDNNRDDV